MGPKLLDSLKMLLEVWNFLSEASWVSCSRASLAMKLRSICATFWSNTFYCNKEKWKRCDEEITSEKTVVWKVAAVCVCADKPGSIFILMLIFILYVVKWLESRQLWCLHVPVTSGKNQTVHDHLVWFSNDANNNINNNLCNLINTHWKDTKERLVL